jgi:hypothetical protein
VISDQRAQPKTGAVTPPFAEIERREYIDRRHFIEEFERPNKPVVITGMKFWSEEQFTLDWLAAHYGALKLSELRTYGGNLGIEEKHQTWTLARYIQELQEEAADVVGAESFPPPTPGALPYISNIGLDDFPLITARFAPPRLSGTNFIHFTTSGREFAQGELFIGPPKTNYSFHFDTHLVSVITYQLLGRKKWVLFPPSESAFLYAGGFYPHHSPIDPFNPDLTAFPLFAKAEGFSTVLEAGEFLLCPNSWWHSTYNLTATVSIAVRTLRAENVAKSLVLSAMFSCVGWQLGFLHRWVERSQRRRSA